MARAPKMRIKRVSGQEGYLEKEPHRLSRKGWGDVNNFFSIRRFRDNDFDEQVYWCLSGGLSAICLNEHEAVALRELLPTAVVGGVFEDAEVDWPEPVTMPRR